MRPALQQIALIEQYLEGKLEGEVLYNFNRRLKADPEFRASVEQQRQLMEGIQYLGLKNELDNIHKDLYGRFNWWRVFGIGMAVLALGGLGYLLFPKNDQQPQTVEANPAPQTTIVEQTPITPKPEPKEEVIKLPKTTRPKESQLSTPKPVVEPADTLVEALKEPTYDLVNIPILFAPDTQKVTIATTKDQFIQGKNGIVISVPKGAFNTTAKQVEVNFIEVFEPFDYVNLNMPTVHEHGMIETGGMIYIEAKEKNGRKLELKSDKRIELQFPIKYGIPKKGMQAFYLEKKEQGQKVWLQEESNKPKEKEAIEFAEATPTTDSLLIIPNVDSMSIKYQMKTNRKGKVKSIELTVGTKQEWEEVQKEYALTTSKLGWINCDRFYSIPEDQKTNVPVLVTGNEGLEYTKVMLVFHSINSAVSGVYASPKQHYVSYGQWDGNHECTFTKLPIQEKITAVAIGQKGDSLYYGEVKNFHIEKGKPISIALSLKDKAELEKELKTLNTNWESVRVRDSDFFDEVLN